MAVSKRGLGKGLDAMIPDKKNLKQENLKQENLKQENRIISKQKSETINTTDVAGNKEKNKKNLELKEVNKSTLDTVEEVNSTALENVSRETFIGINEIEPNKKQPRKQFNEDSILELAESIKQYGVIQPLIVKKQENYYIIIAGERRWRAARAAGLKKVPVIIKDYTPQEVLEIALIENLQREDLNPIEEAIAYQNLIKEFNLKQEEVAERVSKSRVAVTNSMRLLKLDERIQHMLIEGILSSGHARTLLPIEDLEIQYHIATKIFDEKLSVRETEKLVKNLLKPKNEAREEIAITRAENLVYRAIEERMKKIIGTKVTIKNKNGNNGKIEIEYYSNEELERIIELIDNLQ